MPTCETCGRVSDKPVEISYRSATHTFDCFECALQRLAARCECCRGSFIRRIGIASGVKACARCLSAMLLGSRRAYQS